MEQRQCCLFDNGKRCTRTATSTPLSKKMKRGLTTKKINLVADDKCPHELICDHHRQFISTAVPASVPSRDKRKRRVAPADSDLPQVDFNLLSMHTLRRYGRHYKIDGGQSKPDLVQAVNKHFLAQDVAERDAIVLFAHSINSGQRQQ